MGCRLSRSTANRLLRLLIGGSIELSNPLLAIHHPVTTSFICLLLMVKTTHYLLGILLTVATSSGVFAQTTPATDSSKTPQAPAQPLKIDLLPPMQRMVATMKKAKATGDPDVDFARQATIHTHGTQELLKAILSVQPDSALTQTIKTMQATTETDLTTLDKLLKEIKPNRPNAAFTKQQGRVIAAIQEKIKQSASRYKLTNNPDQNIAILLSDQRQDAVNLATAYLQFGKNIELRNFAQQSVEKAKLDIDIIKNLQKVSR